MIPAAPPTDRAAALRDLARLLAAWLVEDHLAGRLAGAAAESIQTKENKTPRTAKKIRVR
jgi:hypothetical protein